MLKKILQAVLILPFLFLVACSSIQVKQDNSTENQRSQYVNLIIESSESKIYQISFKSDENALSLLKRLSQEQRDFSFETKIFEGIGEFVTTINGRKADESRDFWALWINDKESTVGVSDYKVQPNDRIKFKLTQF